MNKKISKVLSIVLYVIAALMLIYSIWSLIFGVQYIQEGIAQEQIVLEGNTFNIVSYFVQNFFISFMYAFLSFGLGWVINLVSTREVQVKIEEKNDVKKVKSPEVKAHVTPKKEVTKKEVTKKESSDTLEEILQTEDSKKTNTNKKSNKKSKK